jgi:hypothetical protein
VHEDEFLFFRSTSSPSAPRLNISWESPGDVPIQDHFRVQSASIHVPVIAVIFFHPMDILFGCVR